MKIKSYKDFIEYKHNLKLEADRTAVSIEKEFNFVKEQLSVAYIFKSVLNYIPTPGFLKGILLKVVSLFTDIFEKKLENMKGVGKIKYYMYLFSTLLIPVMIRKVINRFK